MAEQTATTAAIVSATPSSRQQQLIAQQNKQAEIDAKKLADKL
jgi:hypothetical protein